MGTKITSYVLVPMGAYRRHYGMSADPQVSLLATIIEVQSLY